MILGVVLTLAIGGAGVGLFLIRADQPERQNTKKTLADAKAIVGTCNVVSAKLGGKEPPDADEVKSAPWDITTDKIIVTPGHGEREPSYKLSPTSNPTPFDSTPVTVP